MAELLMRDRLEELWRLIDRQHLGYLESVETRDRSEQRARLEKYIREYLCHASHDRKFNCPQTAEVLRRSATTRDIFSGKLAAHAWDAIAKYADNLVLQPWRKEFCELKLYCGFYKHEVEDALVGAEQMFEIMGYRHSGNLTMTMHGVLDPDRVTSVSKDALMALVECNIMQQIWEAMSRHNVTWAQVLEFRENHHGTPELAIRAMTYRVRQRLYQESGVRPNCSYGSYYDNHVGHHPGHPVLATHSYPTQRYAHIVSPQQILPPPVMYQTPVIPPHYVHQQVLKPHDQYPTNGYHHTHPYYPNQNGYPPQMAPPVYNHPSSVPTAQLIELEPSPSHISHYPPSTYPYPVPDPIRTTNFPSSKAKDDGAGSWENWDYVYRSLENHGYRKDSAIKEAPNSSAGDFGLSDRLRNVSISTPAVDKGGSLTPPRKADTKTRTEGDGEARHRISKNSVELEDAFSKNRLSKDVDLPKPKVSKTSVNMEGVEKNKVNKILFESESNDRIRNSELLTESEFESRLVVPLEPLPQVNLDSKKPQQRQTQVVTLDVSPRFLQEVSPVVELPPKAGQWECVACTYLNSASRNVCEICSKSRVQGLELKPQPCGGQECPRCTLVNDAGRNFCAACQCDLQGSPTYI